LLRQILGKRKNTRFKYSTGSIGTAMGGLPWKNIPLRVRFEAAEDASNRAQACAASAVSRKLSYGRSRFCAHYDANRDGKVTIAEFDGAIAREFASAAGGAGKMSPDQFVALTLKHFKAFASRVFARKQSSFVRIRFSLLAWTRTRMAF
jgi:hypothetical protein